MRNTIRQDDVRLHDLRPANKRLSVPNTDHDRTAALGAEHLAILKLREIAHWLGDAVWHDGVSVEEGGYLARRDGPYGAEGFVARDEDGDAGGKV
jgi:hypothetical protein